MEAKYLDIRFLGKFSGLVISRIADIKTLNMNKAPNMLSEIQIPIPMSLTEELDLSEFSSIDAQIEFLKRRDRVDTMYIT